jgi:hypothetical protein
VPYYPLPPVGAFTGYIGNPYLAAGGYSTGTPAGYPLPLPPRFHESPNADWMTPSEAQFERRHLDHQINLSASDWAQMAILGTLGVALLAMISF